MLDAFNGDTEQKPHTRELFYAYAERTGVKAGLESKPQRAVAAAQAETTEGPVGTMTRQSRFRWWWILVAVIIMVIVVLVLMRACGTAPSAQVAAPRPHAAATPQTAEVLPARTLSLAGLPEDALALHFLPNSTSDLLSGDEARLAALIAALKSLPQVQGTLVFSGYAASIGYPKGEQLVSEGRARYRAERLEAGAIAPSIIIMTEGYGARSMLSGPTQAAAAAASRRVDISIK